MIWHFNAGGLNISTIDKDMADHSSAINDNTQMPSPDNSEELWQSHTGEYYTTMRLNNLQPHIYMSDYHKNNPKRDTADIKRAVLSPLIKREVR